MYDFNVNWNKLFITVCIEIDIMFKMKFISKKFRYFEIEFFKIALISFIKIKNTREVKNYICEYFFTFLYPILNEAFRVKRFNF